MIRIYPFIVFLITTLWLSSCDWISPPSNDKGKPIAQVFDSYLYLEDLGSILDKNHTRSDSERIIKSYADAWITKKLLARQAETNMPEKEETIKKQIQSYRESLVAFLYEKELIAQKLDTFIEAGKIEEYYQKYKDSYRLNRDIYNIKLIKHPKTSTKIDSIIRWLNNIEEESAKVRLYDYCSEAGAYCVIEDSFWIDFDRLNREAPIFLEEELRQQYEKKRSAIKEDSLFYYILKVEGFLLKESLAPMSYRRKDIEKVLLKNRKIDFIKKLHEDIYNQALKEGSFEIYY